MKEWKTLRRGDKPEIASRWHIQEGPIIGGGSEGVVNRVRVFSEKDKDKRIDLALKTYESSRSQIASNLHMADSHRRLKEADIPTIHTLRFIDDEQGQVMTDLTAGGENVVLSENNNFLRDVHRLYEDRPDQMAAFAQQDPLCSDETNARLAELAEKAGAAKLDIRHDAWATVVAPDGSYEFVVADLGNVKTEAERFDEYGRNFYPDGLTVFNQLHLGIFQERISYVQRYATDPAIIAEILIQNEMNSQG